ncbi:hypothetical protein BH11CYA1_BH11CYA1_45710 [soil metagenome]
MFDEIIRGDRRVILLTVKRPSTPVAFESVRYIRLGTSKTTLTNHPEKEASLWQQASKTTYESVICKSALKPLELVQLLDFRKFASLQKMREPDTETTIQLMVAAKLLMSKKAV